MRDYITISATPLGESCAQVGTDNYNEQSRIETKVFAQQCIRVLEEQFDEIACLISIKSFPHDFGSYREVVAYFDGEDDNSVKQAYWLESHTPEEWDSISLQQLKELKYQG